MMETPLCCSSSSVFLSLSMFVHLYIVVYQNKLCAHSCFRPRRASLTSVKT